jgi:hypothetical protein
MKIAIINEQTNDYIQLNAERDVMAILLLAGYTPISINLLLNGMFSNAYKSILSESLFERYVHEIIKNVDIIFLMPRIKGNDILYSKKVGSQITSLPKIAGFPSVKSILREHKFDMITESGSFLKTVQ